MLPEWLEPSIQKRVDDIVNHLCGYDSDALYQKLQKINDKELALELENMFILMTKHAVDIAYRRGISDLTDLIK